MGTPIVYGDGTQSRDFTFVKNVVDANIKACESKKTGIFNIACGRRIILNDLILMINKTPWERHSNRNTLILDRVTLNIPLQTSLQQNLRIQP